MDWTTFITLLPGLIDFSKCYNCINPAAHKHTLKHQFAFPGQCGFQYFAQGHFNMWWGRLELSWQPPIWQMMPLPPERQLLCSRVEKNMWEQTPCRYYIMTVLFKLAKQISLCYASVDTFQTRKQMFRNLRVYGVWQCRWKSKELLIFPF